MSKKLMPHPIFTISLDTELLWGYIQHPLDKVVKLLGEDKSKGRVAIETLLQLFEKYNISATWAVVGHLFFNSNEAKEIVHPQMPEFKEGWLEWDSYNGIYNMPLYCGRDIVEKILASSVRHEIGLHSFSHIPFSQCSQEVAEAELELGMKAAKGFGITPKSFVFPGDYIGHLDVLKRQGFKIYRGKQLGRHGINQSFLLQKFNGAIDKMIAPPTEPKWMKGIWEIRSSMCFCDPQIKFSVLPRAKIGLYRAIKSKRVFHVFLHPHNLLWYSSLKEDLDKFLALVAKKRDEGKIAVMTMGEFAEILSDRAKL